MTSVLGLQAKVNQKRTAAQRILDAVATSPITRDMSPEEKTQFDALMADVATIKNQIVQIQAVEDAEEVDPETVSRSRGSGRRSNPIGAPPAIGREGEGYSILRALRLATEGRHLDGLEGEVSQEIARRTGRTAKGFFLPTGADPVIRSMMNDRNPDRGVRRDLTTTTGAGGIFNVPEASLIDLLRSKLVIKDLGATFLTDMQGVFSIPRQTGKATVYWLAEGNSATASAPSIDQVGFSPKVAIAATSITKMFMNQTSLDAEAFVKNDLAETMARELDRVAINGTGTTQPLGILQRGGIPKVVMGTNGAVPTFGTIVSLESLVAVANADMGKLGYLTNPSLRGYLKQAGKVAVGSSATGYPVFLYETGPDAGVGEMNGYPVRVSSLVPNNLTKGSASGVCSAIIFGNWADLVVAQWEGVDVIVNPYTAQLAGTVTISMEMSVDVQTRHDESFAIVTDALSA